MKFDGISIKVEIIEVAKTRAYGLMAFIVYHSNLRLLMLLKVKSLIT